MRKICVNPAPAILIAVGVTVVERAGVVPSSRQPGANYVRVGVHQVAVVKNLLGLLTNIDGVK